MTWYGTVCSSFSFLNRGTSRRTRAEPRGTQWVASVEAGNLMVTRTALLICLSFAKRLAFFLGAAIKQRYDLAPFLALGAAALEALAVHMVELPDIYGFVRWMFSQAPCFIFQQSVDSTRCSRAPGG